MELVNKLVPDSVFPVQRKAFTDVITSRGNWYELMMRVFRLNPQMRTKLLKALLVDGNLLAWPVQERAREKYQRNIPWAILLDPTSACNLHCTGLLGRGVRPPAEPVSRGYRLDRDTGQGAWHPHVHLHGRRAARAQA